ncbi:MAG: carboxypeptidase regulatory-like domain-containing protein [Deltaproteobacteria bacterium]|nr:carboxypeptidase regulatory-like domain-containing protein [Deltaproteobacteria bacterium]
MNRPSRYALLGVAGLALAWLVWPDDPAADPPGADGDSAHPHRRTSAPDLAGALGKARSRSGSLAFTPQDTDGVVVSGTVIDVETNTPVGGVEVVFRSPAGEESTTSNADGTYRIRMPEGIYRAFVRDDLVLSVGRPDHVRLLPAPSAETAGVPDEALMPLVMANSDVDGMDLSVLRGGTVIGRVVDPAGRPIAGAVLRTRGNGLRPTLGTDTAESDADGHFELRIPAGFYGIDANHPRFAGVTDSSGIRVMPGDRTELTLTLAAGCVISGHVYAANGQPSGDGAMERRWGDGSLQFGPSGRVEADGSFRWVTLTEETVTLRAWPWKSPPSDTKEFTCKDGARFTNVAFRLPDQRPDIEGVLVDHAGAPVPFGFVDLTPLDPDGIGQQERTDAEGRWHVYSMPAGRYRITAQATDKGVVAATVTSPSSGQRLQLGGTGRLAGTTTTLVSGSFEVALESCTLDDTPIPIAKQRRLVAVTAGRFELDNVPACELMFMASWHGKVTVGQTLVPADGVAQVTVDIGPAHAKTVRGRVLESDGKPAADVIITASFDDNSLTARTDANGNYTLRTFSGASLYVAKGDAQGFGQVGMANIDEEQLDLQLQERGDGDEDSYEPEPDDVTQ